MRAKQKLNHAQHATARQARLGPLSYLIETADGQLWRRHIDHLKGGVNKPIVHNQHVKQARERETVVQPMVVIPDQPPSEDTAPGNAGVPETPKRNSQVQHTTKRYELRTHRAHPDRSRT